MRFADRAALTFLLALGACLSVGCSDKSTEPENPLPATGMRHLWSERFGYGADEIQYSNAVAVDASGNVIITGDFSGAVDFGGGAFTSAGGYDIFVAMFGSGGAHLRSMRFGDEHDQRALADAIASSGNAILTGGFNGTVNFGGDALASSGSADVFVAEFAQ